jgi:prepilin-type N-terminal cleavage/methylation domain-containing protein
MKRKSNSAFTLVELIVVITILAILGTIAFISLQWYSADARDSSRISDVNHIKTSLELFSLATWKYPLPDNPEDVTYSWWTVVVWKQWTIWDTVTSQLSRNLNSKPTDPLYETEYIYSTLENGSKYEIMSVYESLAYNNLLLNSIYVANPATVRVTWTYNWLYVKSWNYIIPTPSIITSLNPAWLDFNATTITSQVIDNWTNIPDIGTSKVSQSTWWLIFSTFEVYNWILNKDSSTGSFLWAYNALANTYSGSSIENNWIINSLLTKTTDDEKINFAKTVILNTTSAIASSSTTTYSCIWTVPTSNVTKTNDTWLTIDTTW